MAVRIAPPTTMTHTPAAHRYANPLLYRRCGRSGLKLPAISLGLWHNFGSVDDYHNSRALVLHASCVDQRVLVYGSAERTSAA